MPELSPEILTTFNKTLEEMTAWANYTLPENWTKPEKKSKVPRDPKSFLNYLLDHPEFQFDSQQMFELMRWFLHLDNPDFRFQIPQDYDRDVLGDILEGIFRTLTTDKDLDLKKLSTFLKYYLVLMIKYDHRIDAHLVLSYLSRTDNYAFLAAMKKDYYEMAREILLKIYSIRVRVWIKGSSKSKPYPAFRKQFFRLIGVSTLEQVKEIHFKHKLTYFPEELEAATDPAVKNFLQQKLEKKSLQKSDCFEEYDAKIRRAPDLVTLVQLFSQLPNGYPAELACLSPDTVARQEKLDFFQTYLAWTPCRLAKLMALRNPPTEL